PFVVDVSIRNDARWTWFSGSSDGLALDRAGHAAGSATAAPQLAAGDGDDLYSVLSQESVGGGVALVAEDHTGRDGEEVVAVIPLLALGAHHVHRRAQDPQLVHSDRIGHNREQLGVLGD